MIVFFRLSALRVTVFSPELNYEHLKKNIVKIKEFESIFEILSGAVTVFQKFLLANFFSCVFSQSEPKILSVTVFHWRSDGKKLLS